MGKKSSKRQRVEERPVLINIDTNSDEARQDDTLGDISNPFGDISDPFDDSKEEKDESRDKSDEKENSMPTLTQGQNTKIEDPVLLFLAREQEMSNERIQILKRRS